MFTYAEEGRLHWSQSGCVNRQGVSGKFQISSKVATDHTGETTDRVALRTNPESVPNQERDLRGIAVLQYNRLGRVG